MFASEIDDVTTQFEEEEKAAAEANKLAEKELAEKALQESQEQEKAAEVEDDIPPPPPPPPPPAPAVVPRLPTIAVALPVSENDTALLIQESVFQEAVFSNANHSVDSPNMNITDLLANVQSSDFASHQASISPGPVPEIPEPTVSIPTISSFKERELSKEISESPKAASSDTIVIMSKQDVANEIYQYEKEDKQFTHYSKETAFDHKPISYSDIETRDVKLPERFHDYPPDYKKLSSSYKSRKHIDEYRERSSGSKHSHSRERSLSPRSRERYKEYSLRDYGHGMDRLFKSPEYYMSLTRSSSGRSSSKELSSRERRKREEEWYARHQHSSKHSYSSHKYPELSRRDDYYRDYYEKKRYEDSHYKSSSERSKSREYALYESSRSAPHDPFKVRDSAYEISKIREASELPKFKEPGHGSSKYYSDHEYEARKKKEREHLIHPKMKDDSFTTSGDPINRRIPSERPFGFEEFEKNKEIKEPMSSTSPKEPPPPPPESHNCEKPVTPLSNEYCSPERLLDDEPSSSLHDHHDLRGKAIAKIPKTPEELSPTVLAREETGTSRLKEDHLTGMSPTRYASYNSSFLRSPEKIDNNVGNLNKFELSSSHNNDSCDISKQALIDSILPKPKYCSILKETFAAEQDKITPKISETDTSYEESKELSFQELENVDNETKSLSTDMQTVHSEIGQVMEQMPQIDDKHYENLNMENVSDCMQQDTKTDVLLDENEHPKKIQMHILDNQDFPIPVSSLTTASAVKSAQVLAKSPPPKVISIEILEIEEYHSKSPSPPPSTIITNDMSSLTAESTSEKNLTEPANTSESLKCNQIFQSEIVNTSSTDELQQSYDAEEGEILSDSEDKSFQISSVNKESVKTDTVFENSSMKEESNVKSLESNLSSNDINKPETCLIPSEILHHSIPKVFVPDENFPIRSKRDFFKARFFQPDMKIDFAKPEQEKDVTSEGSCVTEDHEKVSNPLPHETKPNPDEMRYSRKMRFKEVLQQHINEQELKESQQKDIQDTCKDINSDIGKHVSNEAIQKATVTVSQIEGPSPKIIKSPNLNVNVSSKMSSSQLPTQSLPVNSELDVSAVSLIGKRKRFLNDYIASLESNPPPAKNMRAEEVISEETLPKLRIKPLSGGSYCAETLTSTSFAPPPLHKASTTSPEKETVPKCIIKLGGQGNWSTCETERQENKSKGKNRSAARQNLRSREASNDSNKSGTPEKPRVTRSKNSSKKSVKSYDADEDEKNSDNSFEDTEKSRKSGRTRKTIKRLNL